MSFSEIDIFLFEKFFSSKTDSKIFLNMIQMNFNEKFDKANEIKIINRLYDLSYIIMNYLYYQIKGRMLLKEKFSVVISDESYSQLVNSYNNLIKEIKSKFNFDKIPYKYFIEEDDKNKSNLNNIFNNKNRTEFFFHVILNYSYYIIFVHDNQNYKTQHNLIPAIFQNNKKDYSSLFTSSSHINQQKFRSQKISFDNFIIKSIKFRNLNPYFS